MLFRKKESMAQFSDRFLKRTALAVLVMAAAYGAAAISHFVGDTVAGYLHWAKKVFAIGGALIVLPVFAKLMWLWFKRGKGSLGTPAGFIGGMFAKASVRAFETGFIAMIVFEPLSRGTLAHLPPAFFIQTVLAISIAVLGITFFVLSRDDDDEIDDDFGDDFGDEFADDVTPELNP